MFLSKRSTVTNLTESVNDWIISTDNKVNNRVAYIDWCFYATQNCCIVHLDWIADFLSER